MGRHQSAIVWTIAILGLALPLPVAQTIARADSAPRLYFAEGTTLPGFQEYLTFQNNAEAVTVTISYLFADGSPAKVQPVALTAHGRTTVDVNQAAGRGRDVSVAIDTGGNPNLFVERPMYFNSCLPICVDGSHVGAPVAAERAWYFAEGYTGAGFQEYLSLLNPNSSATVVTIAYYLDGSGTPGTRSTAIAANSRTTVDVNRLVGPGHQVSLLVLGQDPIVAERPMYFSSCPGNVCMNGGSTATGSRPASASYFAEGFTGAGFQEYLILYNPGEAATSAAITYMFTSGAATDTAVEVPPHSRVTVDVNAVIAGTRSVAIKVTSTVPLVTERVMYHVFEGPGYSNGGTSTPGLQPAPLWNLAEGYTGPGFQEYLLIQNPNSVGTSIDITYLYPDGTSAVWGAALAPTSRLTVDVNRFVGRATEVAARVTSGLPVVAERTIYSGGCLGAPPVCFNLPPPPPAVPRPPRHERPYRLTIDDCGTEAQLRGIIAAVRDRQLNAWFFPTGLCREQFPWLVPSLLAAGYTVCNHSYSHPVMTSLSDAGISNEISRGVSWQSTGCHQFRPPYGAWDGPHGRVARIAAAQGYGVYMWDIDTRDWAGTSAAAMVGMIKGRRGTVLMHFHGAHTIEAIRQL